MTWTYSGDPSASAKDAVRFTIGDTDDTDELISDEEVTYLISIHNGVGMASVGAARAIAAKYSRKADQSRAVGDLSLSQQYSQQSFNYHHLADHLLAIASGIDAPPLAQANADALGAEFTIGLLDKFVL
jgi:hypothetical protein